MEFQIKKSLRISKESSSNELLFIFKIISLPVLPLFVVTEYSTSMEFCAFATNNIKKPTMKNNLLSILYNLKEL